MEKRKVSVNILSEPKSKVALVSDTCDVDKLDRCLELLSTFCLIADHLGRDKVQLYYAIDPQFAFPAMIIAEMWATDADLHTIGDLLKRKELSDLNARYTCCQTIVKSAKELYKKQLPFLKEAAVVVNGYKRIASCISELLETANENIYAVLSPPHLLGEIVWHTVVEKMKQGSLYQRITTFDELVRHGYEIYCREVKNYNEILYVCKNSALAEKFYVINNITVAFFSPDIKNKDFLFRVQIMNNVEIANRRKKVFDKLKSESINVVDLLDGITQHRDCFLSSASEFLTSDELDWLRRVFDYGVFCNHQEVDQQVYESAKTKCVEKGLIQFTPKNEILANYTLQEILQYVV